MDKAEHGALLAEAMDRQAKSAQEIADYIGKGTRTISNWRNGHTMPDAGERARLRELLGEYDSPGDEVERAIHRADLAPFRRTRVLAFYLEQLHEQQREERAG